MNRLLLAIALLAATAAGGCRSIYPQSGSNCGDACCDDQSCGCSGPSCGCCDTCQTNACDAACSDCPLRNCGNCGAFQRYTGCNNGCYQCGVGGGCGCGYCGDYDCSPYENCGGCPMCGGGGCGCGCCNTGPGCCCSSGDNNYNFAPGPPVAQTAYPYYTVRGPRDFLLNNPPPIGPY